MVTQINKKKSGTNVIFTIHQKVVLFATMSNAKQ